jgi:quercetin dioxygenase-like cupin family protein/DNA-binding XRE family transcriptional regulator
MGNPWPVSSVVAKPVDQTIEQIGRRVAEVRRVRGLTHEQVSGRTGLSAPYLSRIEAGKRQPSIATLLSLAQAFEVELRDLIEGGTRGVAPGQVVRSADAPHLRGNGLRYRLMSSGSTDLEAIEVTVPATRSARRSYSHAGQEWIYVLSGRLRLTLGDTDLELDPGDAATFDAQTAHRLIALDGHDVELLLVAVAPRAGVFSSYVARAG